MKKKNPNANFLPGQGNKGTYPLNFPGLYGSLNDDIAQTFYQQYMYEFATMAQTMIVWENLPDDIPSRFINWCMVFQGHGNLTDYMGKLCFMQSNLNGKLNMYYDPVEYTLYAPNRISIRRQAEDAPICRNNAYGLPTISYLSIYAAQMAELDAAMLVNLNANKTPIIVRVRDKNQKSSLLNAYAKHETNCPVIFELDDMGLSDDFGVINTNAPWLLPDMSEAKRKIRSEALTFLGILSEGYEKKERVIQSEIAGGQQSAYIMRLSIINSLKDFTERANKRFGTNISVHFAKAEEITDGIIAYGNEEIIEGEKYGVSHENHGLGGNPQSKQPEPKS